MSTFEKWQVELNKGILVPGVTHTENFWKENARHLEDNMFSSVKKLIDLLESEDKKTVCLALYDLGEFCRFHPYGKSVMDKLGGKARAMGFLRG